MEPNKVWHLLTRLACNTFNIKIKQILVIKVHKSADFFWLIAVNMVNDQLFKFSEIELSDPISGVKKNENPCDPMAPSREQTTK